MRQKFAEKDTFTTQFPQNGEIETIAIEKHVLAARGRDVKCIFATVGIWTIGLGASSSASADVWPAWQLPVTNSGKTVMYQIDATITDKTAITDQGTQFERSFHNCANIAAKEVGGDAKILAEKEKILDLFESRFQACMEAVENDQGQSMWELGEMNGKSFIWSDPK